MNANVPVIIELFLMRMMRLVDTEETTNIRMLVLCPKSPRSILKVLHSLFGK